MATDIDQLQQALAATMLPDANVRKQAEQYIMAQQKQPGYLPALLSISSNDQIDQNVALAAAVQLGTMVEYHWKFRDETHAKKISVESFEWIIISEQDKEQVRTNIVGRMYASNQEKVVKQYSRCITTIARFDYPERWGTIMSNDIPQALQSQNEKGIYTGLLSLLSLVKKYEFEMEEDREPLFEIIDQSFPILGSLIDQCLKNTGNETALRILHLICKVFYVSNQLVITPMLTKPGALDPWMTFFKTLLDMEIPQELCSFNEDKDVIKSRDKQIFWKIKGIAAKISYRLFSKYGNPAYVDKEQKAFSKLFQSTFATVMLDTHLRIFLACTSSFVGNKCLNFCMKFVSSATKIEATMSVLKPFIPKILYETLIPIMKQSHEDVTLFEDDPTEYIRKQLDFTESIYMPKNTAIDMLLYICMYKPKKAKKPEYLVPYLQWAVQQMAEYQQAIQSGSNPDWRIKEALINSIGHLQSRIEDQEEAVKNSVEPMLQQHVLQELQSAQPLIRVKACWVYGEFCSDIKDEQHILQATQSIFQNINATEVPVKLAAALALARMLKQDVAETFMKPHLQQTLEVYLKMMDEIDSEELVRSLEGVINIFSGDIGPYACQIADQLVQQYKRLVQVDAEQDDGESALAAVGCVTAINRLLEACCKQKDVLLQMEGITMPILMHGLTPDGIDSIEDALSCVTMLLYYKESGGLVSPQMWKLLPQLLHIVGGKPGDVDGGFAFEYMNLAAIVVQNFIAKDTQTLMTVGEGETTTYFQQVFQFVQNVFVMGHNSKEKEDCITAVNIMIALFENLPSPALDFAMNDMVGMLLAELNVLLKKKKPHQRYLLMLIQAIAMAIYNSTPAAFAVLESNSMTQVVMQHWLMQMAKFKKDEEMRRVLFGLGSIARGEGIPQGVLASIAEVGAQIVSVVLRQVQERESCLADNLKYLDKGGDSSSSEEGEVEDDDNDEDFEDDAEFSDIKAQLKKFKEGKAGDMDDDDDDDDSDYDPAMDAEMELYDSNLDEVDELLYLKTTYEILHQHKPDYYAQLVAKCDQTQRDQFLKALAGAQDLKDREAACTKRMEEFDNMQRAAGKKEETKSNLW